MVCYALFAYTDFNREPSTITLTGYAHVLLVVLLIYANFQTIIMNEMKIYLRKRQMVTMQDYWKQLLIQRKRHEILMNINREQDAIKE